MEGNGGDPVENGEYSVLLDQVILPFSDREQSESIEYKLGLNCQEGDSTRRKRTPLLSLCLLYLLRKCRPRFCEDVVIYSHSKPIKLRWCCP